MMRENSNPLGGQGAAFKHGHFTPIPPPQAEKRMGRHRARPYSTTGGVKATFVVEPKSDKSASKAAVLPTTTMVRFSGFK